MNRQLRWPSHVSRALAIAFGLGALLLSGAAALAAVPLASTAREPVVSGETAGAGRPQALPVTLCEAGEIPTLLLGAQPSSAQHGLTSAEAALRATSPLARIASIAPMGRSSSAPVWIVTDRGTFVATILRDGTWFATSATVADCHRP